MNRLIPRLMLAATLSGAMTSMIACSSDESDPAENSGGGTGGGTSGTTVRGGSAGTTNMFLPRGGVSAQGGAATGGAPGASSVVGTGGRSTGMGGMNAAGLSNIDFTCLPSATCTSGCSATCPNAATLNYSCTCSGGQLTCDMNTCAGALPPCGATVASGSACDSASEFVCKPSVGTACLCSGNQWACL